MITLFIAKKKNKKAFTLIELIVVIAIIGVLIAILVPTMTGFVNDARVATANANARTIYSVAQAQATFNQTTTGTAVADGTYNESSTDAFSTAVRSQVGDLATGATYTITVAGGAVTAVTYTGGGASGAYPAPAAT